MLGYTEICSCTNLTLLSSFLWDILLIYLRFIEYMFRASWAWTVKTLPAMRESWLWSLGWEDPLEEGMAAHSSILAWRIPWPEEPGGLQSMGSQSVRQDWVTKQSTAQIHFRNYKTIKSRCTGRQVDNTGGKYLLLEIHGVFK